MKVHRQRFSGIVFLIGGVFFLIATVVRLLRVAELRGSYLASAVMFLILGAAFLWGSLRGPAA